MLQVQAAQQRALNPNMSPAAANITPHLSPGFSQRAPASSSPVVSHSSPPRTSTTPNPPRPPSASQHQGHAQPSPNLPHVAATRQNPAPGMYFPSLHGVQFTPEQMEHAMRLQLMVSGGFHLHCKPEASTAITPCDNAGLCPSASGASGASTAPSAGTGGSGSGSGASSSAGAGAGTGTGRNADWIIPAPALKLAPFILRVNTLSRFTAAAAVLLWSVPVLYIALSFAPPYGRRPNHQFAYVMSTKQVSYIPYNGQMLHNFLTLDEFCLSRDEARGRWSLITETPYARARKTPEYHRSCAHYL
jgi:hypothetical protein